MSTAANDRSIELDCQLDALEQATCALLDVVVMRRAEFADVGIDSALRSALREIGIVAFELAGIEGMEAVAREAVIDAPPTNNALRSNYLHRAWTGIGDRRGGWER